MQRQHRAHINPRRRHQRLAKRQFRRVRGRRGPQQAARRDDPAHQRERVGMHAGTGQAEDRIARLDVARQQRAALRRAHREAGQVVVAAAIHARHFRRFAADQRAARLAAALGDAADDRRRLRYVQPAGGEIVQEEQRLGALHDQVVDAHRHQVDADGGVQAGLDRDAQFGADAVRAGNQDRVVKSRRLRVEQRAEPAEAAQSRRLGAWHGRAA